MQLQVTLLFSILLSYTITAQTVSTVSEGNFHDGLAIDSEGNVYGSDFTGDAVFKLSTDGTVGTFKGGFASPNGIGINSADEIYICDHFGNKIYKYDINGVPLDTISVLTTPAGIKPIPGTDKMLFVEYNTSTINELSAEGVVTQLFAGTPINGPAGIAFIDSTAYIGNFNDRKIYRYENGQVTFIAQLPADGSTYNFLGFLSAKDGLLIGTQLGAHRLYKINPTTGEVQLFAGNGMGSTDGTIEEAAFNQPNGILGDELNNRIYISDAGTKNLRIIEGLVLDNQEPIVQFKDLQLFPNPVIDYLDFKADVVENGAYTITILDTLGKQIDQLNGTTTDGMILKRIDCSNWSKGAYFIELSMENSFISRLIVK